MLDRMKSPGETVLWRGRPNALLFILGNPLYIAVAIGWAIFNHSIIKNFRANGIQNVQNFEILEMPYEKLFNLFFRVQYIPILIIIVLMPLYRFYILRNIEYMVTDLRVYMVSGVLGQDITSLEYREIKDLSVSVNPLEYMFRCGTVTLTPDTLVYFSKNSNNIRFGRRFRHVNDPYALYNLIKQVSIDVTTDQQFPNAFRPDHNPGYRTKMKK